MQPDNAQDNRRELFTRKDGLLRQLRQEEDLRREWGHLCASSAALAKLLTATDKDTASFLIDLSAKAGKQSSAAHIRYGALDHELSNINRRITFGDAHMTRQDLRDEQDMRGV